VRVNEDCERDVAMGSVGVEVAVGVVEGRSGAQVEDSGGGWPGCIVMAVVGFASHKADCQICALDWLRGAVCAESVWRFSGLPVDAPGSYYSS
jgi:hypothetical protein